MAIQAPVKFKQYQDRNFMTIEADDYLFILKEFHRLLRRTLHSSVYAVFCAIEDHAGPGEQEGISAYTCFASHTTLADEVNVKRLTVFRAIKTLEAIGLIRVEDREGETSLIYPIVKPEDRAEYLLKSGMLEDTCIKKIQVIYPLYQNDTTTCIKKEQPPVSKRYTNVTTVKEPQESNKTTDTNVSGEPSSQATNSQILNFPLSEKRLEKPIIKPVPKPSKPRATPKEPEFAKDPRMVVWRKYADQCHYKPWPNEQERNLIFSSIPDSEDHIARWERLIQKWIDDEHGYKIFNIKGLVSVYVKGWRKNYNNQSQRGVYR